MLRYSVTALFQFHFKIVMSRVLRSDPQTQTPIFTCGTMLWFVSGLKARTTPRPNTKISSKPACIKGYLTIVEVFRRKRDEAGVQRQTLSLSLSLHQLWDQSPELTWWFPVKVGGPNKERAQAVAAGDTAFDRLMFRLHQYLEAGSSR